MPDARARDLRERLFLDTFDNAHATGLPVVVCFTPPDARREIQRLVTPAGVADLVPQRGDDLGSRMREAMNDRLAAGAASVVLIGSDLPTLPAEYILDAFAMLDSADLVIGPTDDGGFYLIGTRHQVPNLFAEIEWSGAGVFASVVTAASRHNLTTATARAWWDVDRPEDLWRLLTEPGASVPDGAGGRVIARRVREYLGNDN
jgi:uncharacterized protein